LPGAYREAREVTSCIENFPAVSARTVLAVDELGPGRLFVTNGNTGALDRFADEMVGPLLVGGEGTDELLRTLEAFFDTGRSVRLSSERLGVHQNTVRYRLSRVHAITGLDVAANADDQLSIQVALLVLRLQGHCALRPFEPESPTLAPGNAGHGVAPAVTG
jgi:DNA-binding PucR family transcriptional regulator